MQYCYLNGNIIPVDSAKISINDIGILRGFGVFDFLRTYNGKPALFEEHYNRLQNSAKLLGLNLPISKEETFRVINELIKKNEQLDVGIRIVLTGGNSTDSLTCDKSSPTIFIIFNELHTPPANFYEKGIKLMTFNYQREIPEAKTINYVTKLSLNELQETEGASEILYYSDNKVLEGATSNFFIFKNKTLITPKQNILIGTVRNQIIELARNNFQIEQRSIALEELKEASEAFITSTTREVVPVTKIDSYQIGNGKVGGNTKLLVNRYKEYIKQNYYN